tara:strand:- start:694 stop:897 length:204 start_codon:yes stop_codon:yes gene_type:complete
MNRLYAKSPACARFSPMDYGRGALVGNLMRATIFSATETEKLRADLPAMHSKNPGWSFELRAIKGAF